jgi:ElaB/YqjD/DUF883 family membrane-anchored ribosome-binding protein
VPPTWRSQPQPGEIEMITGQSLKDVQSPSDGPHAPGNGAVRSELGNLVADLEEVLRRAGHVIDVDVTKLRETVRDTLSAAKSGIADGRRKAVDAAAATASATDAYVHRSPWQAIGLAAFAGVTLGFLLRRR